MYMVKRAATEWETGKTSWLLGCRQPIVCTLPHCLSGSILWPSHQLFANFSLWGIVPSARKVPEQWSLNLNIIQHVIATIVRPTKVNSIGVLQPWNSFILDNTLSSRGIITNNLSSGPKGPSDKLFCNNPLQTGYYPLLNKLCLT